MKIIHKHANGQPTNPQDATRVSMPAPPIERLMQMIAYQNATHDNPYMDDTPYRSYKEGEDQLRGSGYPDDMIEFMIGDTATRKYYDGPYGFNIHGPRSGYRIRPTSPQ